MGAGKAGNVTRLRRRDAAWLCVVAAATMLLARPLAAGDDRRLALLLDAQAAFTKVELAPAPALADASACVQTQAAALSVALPAEESDLQFRQGYCQLALAAVTRAPAAFADAAAELDRAGIAMLAWLARRAGQIAAPPAWDLSAPCPQPCQALLPTANLWLGWLAWRAGNRDAAAARFSANPGSGWSAYAAAVGAFDAGRYPEAAARYGETLDVWTRGQNLANPPLALRLAPPVDIPQLLTDLGGAQILAGQPAAAVPTLDRALESAQTARAYFLRARAKELSGQPEAALADYNLATRAAFADATGAASGEAHLYRGILYYRRKDYLRAEDEFSSALSFEIPPALRPDASAWRHLSAVASGSCGASRQFLEQSLATVSPYFPKAEAQALAAACRATP